MKDAEFSLFLQGREKDQKILLILLILSKNEKRDEKLIEKLYHVPKFPKNELYHFL